MFQVLWISFSDVMCLVTEWAFSKHFSSIMYQSDVMCLVKCHVTSGGYILPQLFNKDLVVPNMSADIRGH